MPDLEHAEVLGDGPADTDPSRWEALRERWGRGRAECLAARWTTGSGAVRGLTVAPIVAVTMAVLFGARRRCTQQRGRAPTG